MFDRLEVRFWIAWGKWRPISHHKWRSTCHPSRITDRLWPTGTAIDDVKRTKGWKRGYKQVLPRSEWGCTSYWLSSVCLCTKKEMETTVYDKITSQILKLFGTWRIKGTRENFPSCVKCRKTFLSLFYQFILSDWDSCFIRVF